MCCVIAAGRPIRRPSGLHAPGHDLLRRELAHVTASSDGTFACYRLAMQSISTSELPGIPPAAAMVVRTGGSGPKRPRNISFIAA